MNNSNIFNFGLYLVVFYTIFFSNICYCLDSLEIDSEKTGSIKALTTYCTDTRGCTSTSISDSNVYCRGYLSCYYSSIWASSLLWCSGDLSCYLGTISTASGTIDCYGFQGCRGTTISASGAGDISCNSRLTCYDATISASSSTVSCSGEYGCQLADITSNVTNCDGEYGCYLSTISATSVLNADGYYSAAYATIEDTPLINTHGDHSLSYANISSDGVDTLTVYSDGDNSLNGANIFCYDGSVCEVFCRRGQTCNGLSFYCYDGATCRTFCNTDCSLCPSIIYVDDSAKSNLIGIKDYNDAGNDLELEFAAIGLVHDDIDASIRNLGKSKQRGIEILDVKSGIIVFLTALVLFAVYKKVCSNNDDKYQEISFA